jgi:hypothetical protein
MTIPLEHGADSSMRWLGGRFIIVVTAIDVEAQSDPSLRQAAQEPGCEIETSIPGA